MENEKTLKYQNFISAQNFPESPKNTRMLYPEKYDEHTYDFAMEVPPPPPRLAKINYSYADALLFV